MSRAVWPQGILRLHYFLLPHLTITKTVIIFRFITLVSRGESAVTVLAILFLVINEGEEGSQSQTLKTLPAIWEQVYLQLSCASLSRVVSAPFQRHPSNHIGHMETQLKLAWLLHLDVWDWGICCFLAMNYALRLAFFLSVQGLGFFLFTWLSKALLLVSREKVKSEPIESVKLKTWPWLKKALSKPAQESTLSQEYYKK